MEFKGSIVALVTPFTKENIVDAKALEDLIEWHIHEKTNGIVLLGTTGESPTITDDERVFIIKRAAEISNNQIQIIIGTGSNDTKKSVEYTKMAKKFGADGCLVVTPYYNRPTQNGCIAHFNEIGKVGLPIIVYHHPKRCGFLFEIETIDALSKIPEVIAIKDAYGDVEYAKKIKSLPILSGDDEHAFEWYQNGAVGSISAVANIIPNAWANLSRYCLNKNFDSAKEIFEKYLSLIHAMSLETNPQCVKYALSIMGKCRKDMRLPMLEPKLKNQQKIKAALYQTSGLGMEALNL